MIEKSSAFLQSSAENKNSAQQRESLLYGTSEPNGKMYTRVCAAIREKRTKEPSFNIANHLKHLMRSEFLAGIDRTLIDGMAACCSCIYETSNAACYAETYDRVIQEFKRIDHSSFGESQWRQLYQYAELHGLFRLAVLLRSKYKATVKKSDTGNLLWRKVQCSLEDADFNDAARILELMRTERSYREYCGKDMEVAAWFIDTIEGRTRAQDDYSRFLQNKKIHIYGPLEYEAKRTPEDEIVVRIDDRLTRSSNDRTDVLYINYEISELMKDYPAEYWDRFSFVSLKDRAVLPNVRKSRNMKNFGCLFL